MEDDPRRDQQGTLDRQDVQAAIEAVISDAARDDVGLDCTAHGPSGIAELMFVAEFQRGPTAAPGSGRRHMERVLALADRLGLPVELSCWHWNDQLQAYYASLGFVMHVPAAEPDGMNDYDTLRREPAARASAPA